MHKLSLSWLGYGLVAGVVALVCLAGPAQADCWTEAGVRYQIDPRLLWSIAKVESAFNRQAINYNPDGSYDIGIMQINSRHLPQLEKFGYNQQVLLENPCASVMAGSWILAGMIKRFGNNWRAVGAYNAGLANGRDNLRSRYAQKVWHTYQSAMR